jgi:type II secretory pathway pseudopilin PulG
LLKKSVTGFTLIEIMIGLAIVMIGASAFMLFSEQTNQASRYSRAVSSNNDLIAEIKMALDTELGCSENFRSMGIDKNSKEGDWVPVKIESVKQDSSGKPEKTGHMIAEPGMKYSNYINLVANPKPSPRLEVVSRLPDNQMLLKLVVITDLTGNVQGPKSMVSTIPIMGTINDDGSFSCRGGFQYGGQVNVESTICRLQSNDQIVLQYDPVRRVCVKKPCTPGADAYTATCPLGQRAHTCTVTTNYTSTAKPVVPRKYKNGTERSAGPPDFIYSISPDQTTCTCVYAEEIVVGADTLCQACCGEM